MKVLKLAGVLAVVTVVSALAWGSYQGDNKPVANKHDASAPAKPGGTTQMALPGQTNNAWEIKPFHLEGLDGKKHSLDEWKGRVIVMNFWASWCAPCQYEIKDLVAMQNDYGGRGLQVIGIGLDEARKLANVKRTLGINYPVLVADPMANAGLLTRWGNDRQIVPYTVVIDRDGTIAYIHRGQLTKAAFAEFILPLIQASKDHS